MKTTISFSLLMASTLLAFPVSAKDIKSSANSKPAMEKKSSAPAKDYTIIKLNGKAIKNSEVLEIWGGLFQGKDAPDFSTFDEKIRQNVLRGLVSERLIYKEAVKNGFNEDEGIKKRVENLKRQLIMQGFIEKQAKSMSSDKKLKELYKEKVIANKGQEELKVLHILLQSEKQAKKLSASLKKKGSNFRKVAKEKSEDKGSGVKGGELGWFGKGKMVAEFYAAAAKLKKGEVSDPVKTNFGWHIIKLENRRPIKVDSFEKSKASLKLELDALVAQAYVEKLLKAASIKYFDENGKEKEFFKVLIQPKTTEKPKTKK